MAKSRLLIFHCNNNHEVFTSFLATMRKIFSAPTLVELRYLYEATSIVKLFTGGLDDEELDLKRMFPYAEMTNDEARSSIHTFLTALMGEGYSARITSDYFYRLRASYPVPMIAIIGNPVSRAAMEIFKQNFDVWSIYVTQQDCDTAPVEHGKKFLVRNKAEIEMFISEIAGALVNVCRSFRTLN